MKNLAPLLFTLALSAPAVFAAANAGKAHAASAPGAPQVWVSRDTVHVLRDEPAGATQSVALGAARLEWESFQVFLRSDSPAKAVNIEPGDLAGPGGAKIRAADAVLYRQHQHELVPALLPASSGRRRQTTGLGRDRLGLHRPLPGAAFSVVAHRFSPAELSRAGLDGMARPNDGPALLGRHVLLGQGRGPWQQPPHFVGKGVFQQGQPGLVFHGEGSLVYPARAVGYDGIAPSIRLKALRDGIEDYEYLAILERAGRRAEAETIVRSLTESFVKWEKEATAYADARGKLAAMIVDTKRK